MKILLHTGMPKTGTTSLQSSLAAARKSLMRAGVYYPKDFFSNAHHSLGAFFVKWEKKHAGIYAALNSEKEHRKRGEEFWDDVCFHVRTFRPDTLILSTEALFGAAANNPERLIELRERLHDLSKDILPIMYVREPGSHSLSGYQQRIRYDANLQTITERRIPAAVSSLETLFERDVEIFPFERGQLHHGDVVEDFVYRFLAPRVAPSDIQSIRANETISAEAMVLMNQFWREQSRPHTRAQKYYAQRMLNCLTAIEARRNQSSKPQFKPGIREQFNAASTDLTWLKEKRGITFEAVDYSRTAALAAMPDLSLPAEELVVFSDVLLSALKTELRDLGFRTDKVPKRVLAVEKYRNLSFNAQNIPRNLIRLGRVLRLYKPFRSVLVRGSVAR